MEKNITAFCEAIVKRRRSNMATLLLNTFNLINSFWDFSIYDIFLTRLVVGLTIVVALPCILSQLMDNRNKDDDYDTVELELEEKPEIKEELKPDTNIPSNTYECTICTEPVPLSHLFTIDPCWHTFCFSCMRNYIASKVYDNILKIKCPDVNCNEFLDPEECKGLIPDELFDRWGLALCELTLGVKKFYCPFRDCSMLLMNDGDDGEAGAVRVTRSECPKCYRLFCAQCKVPWHANMLCDEYQNYRKSSKGVEDVKLLEKLAAQKRWQKCPKCKIFVERIDGCKLIKCRCGYRFCYSCAAYMRTHNCSKCANTTNR
ncbi:hypothetical protein LUZ60_002992 [Juncus effusus]|nr:hypothetical protein LUZ60_002992 [Juncus effusus]